MIIHSYIPRNTHIFVKLIPRAKESNNLQTDHQNQRKQDEKPGEGKQYLHPGHHPEDPDLRTGTPHQKTQDHQQPPRRHLNEHRFQGEHPDHFHFHLLANTALHLRQARVVKDPFSQSDLQRFPVSENEPPTQGDLLL